MATSSTAVEMRLQGVDNASALLDAATQKLARLQGQSSRASSKLRDAALGAGRALLFTGPLAALRTLRRSLLATAGAAAAIGYAIDRSAARFGALSDQAAQAGASADEITRLSNALQQAGVRSASVDTIANALGRMAKTTGRSGLAGLRETLAEIAALPDEAGRVAALSEKLGKALGPQFAALVRQGPDALLSSLDAVVAAMPGVSDAIVSAGDSVADGMSSIRAGIKNGWDELLVSVATSIAQHFGEGSFRQLGARVAAYVEYYANVAIQNLGPLWDHLKFWATSLPRIFGAAFADIGDAIQEHLSRGLDTLGRFLPALRIYTRVFGALGNLSAGDLEGAIDTLANGNAPREAGSRLGAVLGEYTGRAWTGATEEAAARLAEKLEAAKHLDDAMDALSGALTPNLADAEDDLAGLADPIADAEDAAGKLGKAGASAAKKTASAWKSAGAIMAGSYEALRIAMQRTSRTASSVAASASAAAAASSSSGSSSVAGGDLATLVSVQRDGWGFLRSSLSSLGVV